MEYAFLFSFLLSFFLSFCLSFLLSVFLSFFLSFLFMYLLLYQTYFCFNSDWNVICLFLMYILVFCGKVFFLIIRAQRKIICAKRASKIVMVLQVELPETLQNYFYFTIINTQYMFFASTLFGILMCAKYSELRNPMLSFSKCNKMAALCYDYHCAPYYFCQNMYTHSIPPHYIFPRVSRTRPSIARRTNSNVRRWRYFLFFELK
jgi:hypothetical protein